tara:strand:+ start:780 stop:3791 length:3012 start_codon:yes stop_codon:yes gene_type:complete
MFKLLPLIFLFQLVFASAVAQTYVEYIQQADGFFEKEAFEESLMYRNKALELIPKGSQEYLSQKSKQLLTQAQLTEDPSVGVELAHEAFSYFKQLKQADRMLQLELYSLLYHSLAYEGAIEESLKVALESKAKIDADGTLEDPAVIDLIYDIGYLYDRTGNYFEAINYYKKSLDLYVAKFGEKNTDVALNYNNLAYSYSHVYNSKYTIEYYRKAAEIWEKVYADQDDKNEYLITVYQNLNAELISYGDLEEARLMNKRITAYFKSKFPLKRTSGDRRYFEARKLMILANVRTYSAYGDFKTAKIYCDSLRAETNFSVERKEDIDFLLSTYMLLSQYTFEKQDYQLTMALCNSVVEIADRYDLKTQKVSIHAKLGTTYEKLRDFDKGLYHIDLAESYVNKKNFIASKFAIQLIKARVLLGQQNLNKSEEIARSTIEQIVEEKTGKTVPLEKVNFQLVNDLGSDNFINIFSNTAQLYLDYYLKNGDRNHLQLAENLFTIAANLFQEYYLKGEFNEVLDQYHQKITEGILEVALLKKASFEDKITFLNLIERNASQHLLKEYEKKIKRKNLKTDQLLDQTNALKNELSYYQKKEFSSKEDSILTLEKLRVLTNELDSLTAIISATEKNYTAFARSDFNMNSVLEALPSDQQILKYYLTENFVYSVLISKNSVELRKVSESKQFKEEVIEFIAKARDAQSDLKTPAGQLYKKLIPSLTQGKLTIIPDHILNYVPFETLYDEQNKAYLVRDYSIAYEYSLPMWLLHQQSGKSSSTYSLAAFSPSYSSTQIDSQNSEFKNLKYAGQEASTIASIFPGDLFSESKATKSAFLKEKDQYSIFHLSMHSELFEEDFNQSFLLFSNEEKLYFSELYGMNIPAKMVVLSACNTGNGLLKKGEGIMSLSRALTYAGVESSIVSLWPVPDKETSEIMISFYQKLKDGQTKDEALANAKKDFIENNPMKTHPFYWAGFIVNGNTSAIQVSYYRIYFGIGLLVFFLIVAGFIRKIRSH